MRIDCSTKLTQSQYNWLNENTDKELTKSRLISEAVEFLMSYNPEEFLRLLRDQVKAEKKEQRTKFMGRWDNRG